MIDHCCEKVLDKLGALKEEKKAVDGIPAVLTDKESRSPYKSGGGPRGPVQRINVRTEGGALIDLKQRSDVVAAVRDFKLARAYLDAEHPELEKDIRAIVDKEGAECC